jgi:hypothetical protein
VVDLGQLSPELLFNPGKVEYWDLGDGWFVRADKRAGSDEFTMYFVVWARTLEHFHYLFLGTWTQPMPVPTGDGLTFGPPPDLADADLVYGKIREKYEGELTESLLNRGSACSYKYLELLVH